MYFHRLQGPQLRSCYIPQKRMAVHWAQQLEGSPHPQKHTVGNQMHGYVMGKILKTYDGIKLTSHISHNDDFIV